jgi:dTDP-4-amino-4,6-dideoxygalactose transaminase
MVRTRREKKSHTSVSPMPFIDLNAQRQRLGGRLDLAVARVMEHGRFVLGPEVDELERRLQVFTGAKHCVTCANGTDALILALEAAKIGAGDAVLVPSFSFVATAEAVVRAGATPVLLDVRADTYNIDPAGIEAGVAAARKRRLRPRAVIAVDLFGQPADYDALRPIADEFDLIVIADAAQSFGASLAGRAVGTLATITTTSFYPSKPLGCYGDGGAIFTDNAQIAEHLRLLRCHGQKRHGGDHVVVGINSRLDTLQAAVLLEKLRIFKNEIKLRNAAARAYGRELHGLVHCPVLAPGNTSVWAQYTVLVERNREAIIRGCSERGIPTAVHYARPIHMHSAYRAYPRSSASLPVAERLARQVVSLPMHPYLGAAARRSVVAAIASTCKGKRRTQHASDRQSAFPH